MKFIIDAQLPVALSKFLLKKGFDVLHTDDLPNKEFTSDSEIRDISIKESRIVITKDSDFLDSYYINSKPRKLLLVSTGNIRNKELLTLFELNIDKIIELFKTHSLVELDNFEIIGHE
jgi:predicted nuclease of predicted toxin-antitoxin system